MNATPWEPLGIVDIETFKTDSNTVHHAAQFLTYAAIHLITKKEDDSHTALYWSPELKCIVGQALSSPTEVYFLSLGFRPFSLSVLDHNYTSIHELSLTGKTKSEVMNWLVSSLNTLGLNADGLTDELHFKLPEHEVDKGAQFHIVDETNLLELMHFRNNGHRIIEHFAANYRSAHPVCIWPHHFDEACYVPLQKLADKDIRSISFGLAVPDENFHSGYFYISSWSKDGLKQTDPPEINPPGKWHNNGWTGQLLEIEDILSLSPDDQESIVYSFMKEGIIHTRQMVGWDYNL